MIRRLMFLVFCVYLCMGFVELLNAQELKLAKTWYVDPKGYFKIIPPAGWKVQEYPQDPRGKVAFFGLDGAELRILASPKDFSTFEELFQSSKEVAEDIKNRFGINVKLQKITFLGKEVVKRELISRDTILYAIEFMVGNVRHDLQYGAPEKVYEKYLPIVMKAMETYEPIQKDMPSEEIKKVDVANKLRLAQLFFEQRDYELALQYINDGLEIDPQNQDLLKLKDEIIANQKREDEDEDREIDLKNQERLKDEITDKSRVKDSKSQNANIGERTRNWPVLEDRKFLLRYPPGWRVREKGETDEEGEYFSVNDNTSTVGGIGIYFIKRGVIFTKETKQDDIRVYESIVREMIQGEVKYVGPLQKSGFSGKRFEGVQTVGGKKAEWKVDIYEYDKEYICIVFGFFRPDNAQQHQLIEDSLGSIQLKSANKRRK